MCAHRCSATVTHLYDARKTHLTLWTDELQYLGRVEARDHRRIPVDELADDVDRAEAKETQAVDPLLGRPWSDRPGGQELAGALQLEEVRDVLRLEALDSGGIHACEFLSLAKDEELELVDREIDLRDVAQLAPSPCIGRAWPVSRSDFMLETISGRPDATSL